MEHRLNITPRVRTVKKMHFGLEKGRIIFEEVKKILEVGHVKEIQFPI